MSSNIIQYSVIIPAYNEAKNIRCCLQSIQAAIANRNDVEILVIDNGSTDDTVAIAQSFGAKVCIIEIKSIAALRNAGVAQTCGKFLLFLDADMQVPENWLEKVAGYFSQENNIGFSFVDDVPENAPWYAKYWALRTLARFPEITETDFLPTRNLCVSHASFEAINGFDEKLTTSEDKDFTLRLVQHGVKILSIPEKGMYHLGYEKSLTELMRKEFWRQGNNINMMIKFNFPFRLIRFPLVSLLHIFCFIASLIAVQQKATFLSVLFLISWFLPGFFSTIKYPLTRSSIKNILGFTFLYWLRFNIAGCASLREIFVLLNSMFKFLIFSSSRSIT